MTLALSCIAQIGIPRRTGFAMPAVAVVICGLVLMSLAVAGVAISWAGASIVACASVCAATDLKSGLIFDRVLLASLIATVAASGNLWRLTDGAVAALLCAGALLIPFVLSRGRAMGLGDVKFAGTAALALGVHASLEALWFACVSGGGVAAIALLTGRVHRRSRMPFGTFLALGACAALFTGGPR
jgi:leader peptidase (prepilin peptidase) / N-methyltransferase